MRRLVGLLMCGLLVCGPLAGCGGSHGPDAASSADVRLVSQTAGGGRTETRAKPLADQASVQRYLAGLDAALATRLRAAIAEEGGPGPGLFAQVVAVGCDVPPGATVHPGRTVVVRPEPVLSPKPECLAPVTTVALVRLPVQAPDGY